MARANKPSDKRRFPRKQTRVEAVLSVGDKSTVQCVILDFCEQGLFLQLQQPSARGLQKNRSVKLYFSANFETGKEYFQIDATVARVADDGIGLVFENISESMYEALMQTTDMGSFAAYSKNPSFFISSSNQDRFKNDFKDMLAKNIPLLMQEFFTAAEDELENNPEYVENFQDISSLNSLTALLRINKDALINGFCQELNNNIDFTSDKNRQTGNEQLAAGLSLVEKDDFEDWLNFSTVIRKINNQFKNQLYQIELKLSYVTCFPRYLINNPIDPEHLCECFRKRITDLEDSVAAKKTLYKAFQLTLIANLATLYEAFDALLVEHGAPPNIARDIIWKKNYAQHAKPQTGAGNPYVQPSLPSFDNEEYHYADGFIPAIPAPARPAHIQPRPVSETASKLFSLINQSLTSLNHAGHLAPAAGTPAVEAGVEETGIPIEQEYSADELLSALTKMQASRNAVQYLPANTTQLLLSQLEAGAQGQGQPGSKALSTEDQQKLSVSDQLFQALLNELVLTPTIRSYMENIKLPLMALTLQEPGFLDSENHPARDLLNQLFALETAVNQNRTVRNMQIKPLVDQIVGRITQGSITNPDLFAKINEELKEISQPIVKSKNQNIRRVIEIYEGRQKLELARQRIQKQIDERLIGRTIPAIVQKLLDAGWQHLLVISDLNEDDHGNHHRYLEVLEELLTWYESLDQMVENTIHKVEEEISFIEEKLAEVCTNAFTHTNIIDELKSTLIGNGYPKIRKNFDTIVVQPRPKPPVDTSQQIMDSWHLQVDQFKPGDWFTFSMENHSFEPLKLVWVGETPRIYVFVNRDGYKKQELTRHELAELLQIGVVTQIENLDEPLMDRATTTMLQQMQEKLIHSVSHDPITSLPNRKRFINLLREQFSRPEALKHVLCYLEIEDFRIITNICGIGGGDQLLLQTAQLINGKLGEDGIISRLGDKTFGFLLKNCTPEEGYDRAKKIREVINKTNFVWNDKSYTIGASIGLVPVVDGNSNVEELMQKADTVNIFAKRAGHNRIRVYQENDEVLQAQTDIHEWAGRIDRIFAENRLFARCQMIAPIDPEKNSHSHYEILLGVRDENGQVIAPDKFIPAVERCQRMPEIDRWIIENVFSWINEHRIQFEKLGGFAINLSGQSLNSEDFLVYLKDRLAMQDVPCDKITFEITETVAADSLVFTRRFIHEIKQFGCKFSLDDFGTGYSSYSYLKSLDVNYLKIDGAFIKDIVESQTDVVMVNSMNEIAHSLELETIAEYVENMEIHAVLKDIGIDYAQGWGIQKPIPLAELESRILDAETAETAEVADNIGTLDKADTPPPAESAPEENTPSLFDETPVVTAKPAKQDNLGDPAFDDVFYPFDP